MDSNNSLPVDLTIEDRYPLSPMQLGMLVDTLYSLESNSYTLQLWADFRADLDVEKFWRAWEFVVQRHTPLRSSFHWAGLPQPEQVVHRQVAIPVSEHDLRSMPHQEQQAFLHQYVQEDFQRGVPLDRAPLYRLALFRLAEDRYRFLRTSHHLVTDGHASGLVYREVLEAYAALRRGQAPDLPPARPYRAYIDWLTAQDWSYARDYWKNQLADFRTPTPLVVDQLERRGAEKLPPEYRLAEIRFSTADTQALRNGAERFQVTVNILVQAAWSLLLSRYSGESQVIFGAVRNCRHSAVGGALDIVGPLINTLPRVVCVPSDQVVQSWLQGLRQQWQELRDFENTPLPQISAWCGFSESHTLFDSLINFQRRSMSGFLQSLKGELAWEKVWSFQGAGSPLNLAAFDETPFWLELAYDARRFSAGTIERMLGHLHTLLVGLATAGVEQPLSSISMLSEAERRQLIEGWSGTRQPLPPGVCIHHLVEAQVERTPEATAVVFEGETLTYRELDRRANQLAHHLRKQGVGPNVLAAVCMERSLETVIAVLGVVKAGGAYVPIDPGYPVERLGFMLQDTQAPVILAQERLLPRLQGWAERVICLDADWAVIAREPETPPAISLDPENLAYVIYTSGSTGQPKGTMIPHRALVNHMLWMARLFPLSAEDRVIQRTPFSFDASVWEFYGPLMCGARLVLARPEGHQEIGYLVDTITQQRITIIQTAPAILSLLANHPRFAECTSLRHIFCGGEALPPELPALIQQKLTAQVHNLYGPSEACIDTTIFTWPFGQRLPFSPIGRPIDNVRVYILDARLQPVPIGVPGELYVAGAGLGQGYWRRPELTQEHFLADPFVPGERMYRSGDLARYLPDGNFEFLGRVDFQVKIRGLRVELEEIEAVLSQHPAVQQAVARLWDDAVRQDQYLVAYAVLHPGMQVTALELQAQAALRLPDYMVPATITFLDRFPLSPSGKVDRKALPPPVRVAPSAGKNQPPASALEQVLAEMWAEILGVEHPGREENFFALGGHSLLAMRLAMYVAEVFQVDLPLRSILEHPTVAGLARALASLPGQSFEALERAAALILQVADLSETEAQARLAGTGPRESV